MRNVAASGPVNDNTAPTEAGAHVASETRVKAVAVQPAAAESASVADRLRNLADDLDAVSEALDGRGEERLAGTTYRLSVRARGLADGLDVAAKDGPSDAARERLRGTAIEPGSLPGLDCALAAFGGMVAHRRRTWPAEAIALAVQSAAATKDGPIDAAPGVWAGRLDRALFELAERAPGTDDPGHGKSKAQPKSRAKGRRL